MMIGTTEMNHGLYILKTPVVCLGQTQTLPKLACINSVNTLQTHKSDDCTLWHRRFGHPSDVKLIEINKMFPFVKLSKSHLPCDICFFAKQKRLPFHNSTHISSHNFDLVHMDIWGP
jgi:hypothetical protein